MEQMNQNQAPQAGKSRLKSIIAVVVAIIVIIVLAYSLSGQKTETPTVPSDSLSAGNDTTAGIQNDLNAVDMGNLDAELNDIDTQLNNL
jgi:flagellar basal body-associated protein FliL